MDFGHPDKFLNPQQPLLAHDKVRHVGEEIAIIVAESASKADIAILAQRFSFRRC